MTPNTTTENIRYGDVKEQLKTLIIQGKLFSGWVVMDETKWLIREAADYHTAGKESQAIRAAQQCIGKVKNSIVWFFINSPKYFDGQIQDAVDRFRIEQETIEEVDQVLERYEASCAEAEKIHKADGRVNLEKAAAMHTAMSGVIRDIKITNQGVREKKAQALKAFEEAQRLEAQKKLEEARNRRAKDSEDLLALIA